MNEIRVLLGVATSGTPSQPFIDGLTALRLPQIIAPLKRSVAVGNYIPAQRELIMGDAIDEGYDFLFFVDDDIVLPPNALELLIETAQRDPMAAVIGGLYYSRDSVRPVTVTDWSSADTSGAHIPAFTTTTTSIVDGVGFGCALLRISAARALIAPYFPAHIYIERSARRARQCDEDYLYCERVRNAGHVVRLDARVRCKHYDRGSDSIAPVVWEPDAITGTERMIVSQDGIAKLVPFDSSVPQAPEHHAGASLTYITVD